MSLTGSYNQTPTQLSVDISSMANYIAYQLNNWANAEKGIAVVAENLNEKVLPGWNNCIGPKCLVVYEGEEMWGDPATADLVGWAKRTFNIIVQRGKILADPRNSNLTKGYSASKSFYQLVEGARDTLRGMIFPTNLVYNPVLYNGMTPGEQNEKNQWLLDSYIISISVLCQIPRIQSEPPEFGNPPQWVDLNDPNSIPANNTSPVTLH